ncbi:hypothetical protein RDI58_004166 [Solanum bulbocastanum]|uniref:RNase H type-1 domain-containing protein n=1 Tax=Solanum bulbocastanum TaxID=147425 RepID=A0AAN8YL17_SOLBU
MRVFSRTHINVSDSASGSSIPSEIKALPGINLTVDLNFDEQVDETVDIQQDLIKGLEQSAEQTGNDELFEQSTDGMNLQQVQDDTQGDIDEGKSDSEDPTTRGRGRSKSRKSINQKINLLKRGNKRMMNHLVILMISALFWNIRRVRSKGAIHRLKNLVQINNIQFVAIFEPFVDKQKIDGYRKFLGFHQCLANSNGKIWCFWRNNNHVELLSEDGFMEIVKETWDTNIDGNPMWVLQSKLKLLSRRLSLWSRERIGDVHENASKWENKLQTLEELDIQSIEIGNPNKEDQVFWDLTESGKYSNNSSWNLVRDKRPKQPLINKCASHDIAEAKAAWFGGKWCKQNGYTNIIVELDSLLITNMLKEKKASSFRLNRIIEATSSILDLASIKFEHCYREANQLADWLAKMAVNSQTSNIYLSAQQLPKAAKGLLIMDKRQVPSIRSKVDKEIFFVS